MIDPFAMGLFGGLPETATDPALTSIGGTTRRPKVSVPAGNLWDLAKPLSCELMSQQPSLSGASLLTMPSPSKKALIAPCSVTKAHTSRRSLSDRLTPSLITAGLVCGITPMSIRQTSDQPIRAFAFSRPDGEDAVRPKAASSFSKGVEL